MELSSKIFYGALGLLTLVLLGGGLARAGGEGLAFGLFTVLTLGGALVCVWERSVVRSAFSLMATFSGIAGFFVLLGADFLAMAQLLIYVGGILALLLFGVMLTPPDMSERKLPRVLGGILLTGLGAAWIAIKFAEVVRFTELPPVTDGEFNNAERIGVGFLAADQYIVAFELAAVVLTVALVAAVYIARRKSVDLEAPEGALGEGDVV